jgi:hypothetical protein
VGGVPIRGTEPARSLAQPVVAAVHAQPQPGSSKAYLPWLGRRSVGAAKLRLVPHSSLARPGELVTLEIVLDGASAVSVIQLDVDFAPEAFLAADADCTVPGVQLNPPVAEVNWWHAHSREGRVGAVTAPKRPVDHAGPDTLVLARLQGRARVAGEIALDIHGAAWDHDGQAVRTLGSRAILLSRAAPLQCPPRRGGSFSSLTIEGAPSNRPARSHADLNLRLRGWVASDGYDGLVDSPGELDPAAPQLAGLIPGRLAPGLRFSSVWRVRDWNWEADQQGSPLRSWPVTMAGFSTVPGEALVLPPSGYDIGSGFDALVLYAAADQLTVKYTREDNVIEGYTLHVEQLCVDPGLVARYDSLNAQGRRRLPALAAGQPFGTAGGEEVLAAIRDSGAFMDPRIRKDWWTGFPQTGCAP